MYGRIRTKKPSKFDNYVALLHIICGLAMFFALGMSCYTTYMFINYYY